MCAALQRLKHRSCGETQPPTLPEYGDRKTVTPLTAEKTASKSTEKTGEEENAKGEVSTGEENGNQDSFLIALEIEIHIEPQVKYT